MSRTPATLLACLGLLAVAILCWWLVGSAAAPPPRPTPTPGSEDVAPGAATSEPEVPRAGGVVTDATAAASRSLAGGPIDVLGRIGGDRALVVELLPAGASRETRLLTSTDGSFRGTLVAPLTALAIAVRDFEGPLFEVRRERSEAAAGDDWDLGVIEPPPVAEGAVVLEVDAEREVAAAMLASQYRVLRAKVRLARSNGLVAAEREFAVAELAEAEGPVRCRLDYEGGDSGRPVFVEWSLMVESEVPGREETNMRIDELPFAGGAPRLGRLSLRRADVVTGRLLYADDSPGVGLVVRYVGGQKRPLWVHLDTRADEAGAFCFVLDAGGSGTVSALQFEQQDRRPGVSMRVVGGQDITLRLETVPLRLRLVDESGRPVEDFCFHGPRIQRDEGPHPDGVVAAPASLLEIRPWLMFTFADRPFGVLRGCVVRGTGTDP